MIPGLVLGVALAVAVPTAAASTVEPRLVREPDGGLALERLPPVLAEEDVARSLRSGLTTTVVVRVELLTAAGAVAGGARIEVRFEPWDETYLTLVVGIDGRPGRAELADAEALAAWWRELRLRVVEAVSASTVTSAPAAAPARVELDVLPFSQAERDDTQRWFSEALEGSGSTAAEAVGETASEGGGLRRAVQLLVATSIQRGAIASRSWRLPVQRPAPGGRR